MTKVVLTSGGMDSFLAWALMQNREEVFNVFVNIDQKYHEKERWAVRTLQGAVPGFKVVTVQGMSMGSFELPSGIIPNRNAELILAAAMHGSDITLGILHGEINSDKSPMFLEAMEAVLNISNRGQYWNDGIATKFRLHAPLDNMTKSEALQAYLDAGMDSQHIHTTVSCYSADKGHCGRCASCFKRWVALMNCGLIPSSSSAIDFKSDPVAWGVEEGIFRKCEKGVYAARRTAEIVQAMKKRGGI